MRYMQECEDVRKDVVTINLSMMTYKWFKAKKHLFPEDVIFPGSHHYYIPAKKNKSSRKNATALDEQTFTLYEFVKANAKRRSIFLGGKLSYPDALLAQVG